MRPTRALSDVAFLFKCHYYQPIQNTVCTAQDIVKHAVFSINLLKTFSILQRIAKKPFTQNKVADALLEQLCEGHCYWSNILCILNEVLSLVGTVTWAATNRLHNTAAQKISQISFVDLHKWPDGSDSLDFRFFFDSTQPVLDIKLQILKCHPLFIVVFNQNPVGDHKRVGI